LKILNIIKELNNNSDLEDNLISLNKYFKRSNDVIIYTDYIKKDIMNKIIGCNLITKFNSTNDTYIIDKIKPEIIIIHGEYGLDIAIKLKKENLKIFMVLDKFIEMDKNKLSYIDKIIVTNNNLKEIFNLDKSLIDIIPLSINLKEFFPTKASIKFIKDFYLNKNFRTLTAIHDLENDNYKPIDQILNISNTLAKRIKGLNLIIIGKGNKLEEIKNKAKKLKDNDLCIKILEQTQQLRSCINLSDLVLTSNRNALAALICNKNVFYVDKLFKGLVDNDNYYDCLFTDKYFTEFEDEELIKHLTWMLIRENEINNKTNKLSQIISDLCDLNKNANKYL